jgi:hypothetical protein
VVELHDPQTYALVDAQQAVLYTDGTASIPFTQSAGSYYIVIKHRNTLQTWSAGPVDCSESTALYNFTTAPDKAYGNNQVQVEPGVWAFFTGDLNLDEYIDAFDYSQFNDDNLAGIHGIYIATDMNGDGFVDAFDYSMFNDNNLNGVMSIHP